MPGTRVITREADYLYARMLGTPVLKFTDDVEFWLDARTGDIHFRSASRLGRGTSASIGSASERYGRNSCARDLPGAVAYP